MPSNHDEEGEVLVTSTPMPKRQRSFVHHNRTLTNSQLDDSFLLPNNDVGEKKKLHEKRIRKSMHLNIVKDGTKPDESGEKALSKLSEKEQLEHYQLCIKLSCENKISNKNAFGLHLIEYFLDNVKKDKDVPNFQAASIALQASTKIYSVRVDTLYSEANKVMGGMATKNTQQPNDDLSGGGGDIDNADDIIVNADPVKEKRKCKKKFKRYVTEDSTSIDVSNFGEKEMPFEKHAILTSAFESDMRGLLYQLTLNNDNCHIQVIQPVVYFGPKEPSVFPQHSMSELVSELDSFENVSIVSPTVDQFSFAIVKWPLNDSVTLQNGTKRLNDVDLAGESANIDFLNPGQDQEPAEDAGNVFDLDVNNDEVLPPFDEPNENGDVNSSPPRDRSSSNMPEDQNLEGGNVSVYIPPLPPQSKISLNDVTQCLVDVSTEYNAMDPNMELQILGHNILKARQKQSKPKASDTKPAITAPKESMYFTFEDSEFEGVADRLAPGKNCLSSATLKRWAENSSNNLLPSWTMSENKMRALFTKPTVIMSTKHKEEKSFTEPNDALDYDDVADDFGGGDDFSHHSNISPITANSPISLIESKNKVVKDTVSYDKIAKKINQKFVKGVLFKIVKQMAEDQVKENQVSQNVPLKFRNAYKQLQIQLPEQMKKDISVHLAFAILLHLTNEQNLYLKSTNNMKDVEITCPSF